MAKLEKEIKILNVDVDEIKHKLENIGAEFKGTKNQKIYTYDIPTINYRYLEAIELLKSDRVLVKKSALAKLSIVLDEFSDLISDDELNKIYDELKINSFNELLSMSDSEIVLKLEEASFLNYLIGNMTINPNKWLRLRKSNDKIELTLKHVYIKNDVKIQKVKEYEVNTSDLNETNLLLENLGLVRRNYQEKIRHSYKFQSAEIEIDEWPMLDPYIEIECDDENLMHELISKLELTNNEIVSLNTEQLYKRKNVDVLEISDLKF